MERDLKEMSLEELWKLFPIMLQEHQPQWKLWYQEEAGQLRGVIGESLLALHHGGSTAVKGLLAKPTVDIFGEMDWQRPDRNTVERLEADGWILMTEGEVENRRRLQFGKGYTPNGFAERVFHLHLRMPGDCEELYFRDYLRAHPKAAVEYGELKRSLQPRYEHDRDGYTAAKTEFVNACTQRAKEEFPHRYGRAEILQVETGRKRYLPLLLLADEQESMIDRYLEDGELYVLNLDEIPAGCMVLQPAEEGCEIKNLAVAEEFQGFGYGRRLVDMAVRRCRRAGWKTLFVGTGESPLTLPFYQACGFQYSHRIQGFFTEYYDHPIWEGGRLLEDMIYLKKDLE